MNATQTTPVNVLLIDDHTILRQGLKQLLETDNNICICGEADNGEDAIFKALSLKPDVILMDINLPRVNGYEASRAILTAWPSARIIVLTNQDDTQVLKKFLDLGIKGFLLKDIQIELLIDGIQRVVAGEVIELSTELSEKVKSAKTSSKETDYDSLTDREKEVLSALAKGYSNQQLAKLLMVSPKTVHNHLYNIYSKIGVNTRAEAIVWAIEAGFTDK
jgi:two-component system, NarL family, response regulator DegU